MTEKINITNQSEDNGSSYSIVSTKNDRLERRFFLKDKRIGVSISECEELKELGFGINHLQDAIIESAKYILSLGGSLAYGGDLRNGGFTEFFFDLVNYYNVPDTDKIRFNSYLAWPLSLHLTKEQRAELKSKVTFVLVEPPKDISISHPEEFLSPTKGYNQYIWSRCLSEMRKKMNEDCDARIFLGGKTSDFKGKYPGVLEEFIVSTEKQQPIFLIGAFGGVTKQIIEILDKKEATIFENDYLKTNDDYQELISQFNEKSPEEPINYENIKELIIKLGWEGISEQNGLSIEQNKRLAETTHINEIIYLIILGLTLKFTS